MSSYACLLRAVNVGAHQPMQMAALRKLIEELGFSNVRSYVQSGNVVFDCHESRPEILTQRIEAGIHKTFGYNVPAFILSLQQLENILRSNPFLNDKRVDPKSLHVTFLYHTPPVDAWQQLLVPPGIADEFARGDTAIYLVCPNGYGKSKLSNAFFERKLGMPVTTRNWNTVNALYKMMVGR